MKTKEDSENPLETLEALLEKSCKEDETLEALLNGVTSLRKVEDIKSDLEDANEDEEPILPAAQPLQTLFNKRAAFSSGGDISCRVSPTLWYSTPPPDDVDVESELVSCDFEEVKTKYFPDFDIKAELEKGLLSSVPDSPKRKHGLKKLGKRKFASMILEKGDPHKKAKQEDRGRGRGGMFRGGRGGQRYDNFRARIQNTSRPPSMHVDDYVAMESGRGRGRGRGGQSTLNDRSTSRLPVRKIQTLSRSSPDHHRIDGGFLPSGGRWEIASTSRREVSLTAHPLHTLRNQHAWEPRQAIETAGFLERGFQRANWGTPATVHYRGFRETAYRDQQLRGGFWAGPQQDTERKDARFLPPPPASFDSYRTGGTRGRHLRSFTR
ncbi:protein virilizer homolog isoform X2 [Dendronephthya gigantea]|uniref:protein virilizer homolog isoform X2 n=1 Tax=Dendronephthya gigantea TaxID=151771 RepID=UPI00106953D7|nr:protein virilizer homolog isoform X2 [Dendronephthya gigantea]